MCVDSVSNYFFGCMSDLEQNVEGKMMHILEVIKLI